MRRADLLALAALVAACSAPNATQGSDPTPSPTTGVTAAPLPSNPNTEPPVTTAPTQPDLDTGSIDLVEITVVHVDDGDSLIVELDGREERVRLLGINAPERDECLGDDSRDALEAMVGDVAVLGLEAESRDQFDRILAHVFVEDTYVNLAQVEAGLAIVLSDENAFSGELTNAQNGAEAAMAGLWSPDVCGGGPIPDLEITRIDENPPGADEDSIDLEIVEITNRSEEDVELSGFVLRDESTANRFEFPDGVVIGPGESIEVSAGCDPPGDALSWCSDSPVWNNGGDTALLLDRAGRVVDHLGYRR